MKREHHQSVSLANGAIGAVDVAPAHADVQAILETPWPNVSLGEDGHIVGGAAGREAGSDRLVVHLAAAVVVVLQAAVVALLDRSEH